MLLAVKDACSGKRAAELGGVVAAGGNSAAAVGPHGAKPGPSAAAVGRHGAKPGPSAAAVVRHGAKPGPKNTRPKGSAVPPNFGQLMEEEGYAVATGLVDKETVAQAVQAIKARVQEALEGYGVKNPEDMQSLLGAAKHFGKTPANWTGVRFGGFGKRGWVKPVGGGRLFLGWDAPVVEACREATRDIVAHWHQSAGGSGVLRAMPEKCSVKPGGCPALPPHLDKDRVGTLQVVIALSDATEVILWPRSHKLRFNPGGSGMLFPSSSVFPLVGWSAFKLLLVVGCKLTSLRYL